MHYKTDMVIEGDTFCAKRCGIGCTRAEFKKARADARAVRKKLGYKWKIELWDNMGWYWQVYTGNNERGDKGGFVCVRKDYDTGSYICEIRLPHKIFYHASTPLAAFHGALAVAGEYIHAQEIALSVVSSFNGTAQVDELDELDDHDPVPLIEEIKTCRS
jgi:hypothetical protein